jgi:GTPase
MQRPHDPSGRKEPDQVDEELSLPLHLQRYGRRVRNACEFSGPSVLSQECDEGSVEYKLRLQPGSSAGNCLRFQQLVTQLQFRLSEGGGTCFYCIGVEDNGHPRGLEEVELKDSLLTLEQMAYQVGAEARVMEMPPGTEGRRCAVVKVQMKTYTGCLGPPEIRVAVAGSADSGKSTLIAVLTHGSEGKPTLDNGRGAARMSILRHKHEIESGRTSCVTHCILGYGDMGRVLNYDGMTASVSSRGLSKSASRLIRFSDLAGHERFSKTLIRGMTSTRPDYVMVCVCASTGVSTTTAAHLAVAFATGALPFVVITKSDTVERGRVLELMNEISSLVAAANQKSVAVHLPSHARSVARSFKPQQFRNPEVPIFAVSSLTGEAVESLHAFFTELPLIKSQPYQAGQCLSRQVVFQIDSVYNVPNVGCVLSGIVVSGARLDLGSSMCLGPIDDAGSFERAKIVGIRRAHEDISSVCIGQHATVAVQQFVEEHGPNNGAGGDDADDDDEEKEEEEEIHGHSRSTSTPSPCNASVDAKPPGLYKITSSAADLDILGRSWEVAIQKSYLRQGSNSYDSGKALEKIRIRKGAVLLSLGDEIPGATLKFIAYVMFASVSKGHKMEFIVHCDGIRQSARIIKAETQNGLDSLNADELDSWKAAQPSCMAAIRLLQTKCNSNNNRNSDSGDFDSDNSNSNGNSNSNTNSNSNGGDNNGIGESSSDDNGDNRGQVTEKRLVCFEFLHRPEWMMCGSRLILQERGSGKIVGAGMVVGCHRGTDSP